MTNQSDNYESVILEYKIHAEFQLLIKNRVPDVYVIPSASSSFIWYGVIFLHQGIYEGGIFRFTLFIPDDFDCPRVIFNPIVFHPMINIESGELDVKQYITNWKNNLHHVYHVLFYVRRIFYQIETKSALNKRAADMYELNFDEFMRETKQCIDECQRKAFDAPPINADDPHAIRFSHMPAESLDEIKKSMKTLAINYQNETEEREQEHQEQDEEGEETKIKHDSKDKESTKKVVNNNSSLVS